MASLYFCRASGKIISKVYREILLKQHAHNAERNFSGVFDKTAIL
jgi:hypothetical protein